jgi:hypothetical protein
MIWSIRRQAFREAGSAPTRASGPQQARSARRFQRPSFFCYTDSEKSSARQDYPSEGQTMIEREITLSRMKRGNLRIGIGYRHCRPRYCGRVRGGGW